MYILYLFYIYFVLYILYVYLFFIYCIVYCIMEIINFNSSSTFDINLNEYNKYNILNNNLQPNFISVKMINKVFHDFTFKNSEVILVGDIFTDTIDNIKKYDIYVESKTALLKFVTHLKHYINEIHLYCDKMIIYQKQDYFTDKHLNRPIYIYFKIIKSPKDLILTFDIPLKQIYYDGYGFYGTEIAKFCLENGYILYNNVNIFEIMQMTKSYINKGFILITKNVLPSKFKINDVNIIEIYDYEKYKKSIYDLFKICCYDEFLYLIDNELVFDNIILPVLL